MSRILSLNGRYYRAIPLDKGGYETQAVELDADKTTLVVLHCWDIGCAGGPAIDPNYLVGMGTYESFHEASRIMKECIRPAMDAAREAHVLVSHVEHPDIWKKHPECKEDIDPPGPPPSYTPPPVVPGWREHIAARSHGTDYATKSPYARMDRATIVAALPGEPFVYQTNQFDRVLRRHGIENLIYCGFATDMCILFAPGGIQSMAGFGYRTFLMRDATAGIDFADTFADRIATRWAIRYFETHYGDTIRSAEFIAACRRCGPAG